ncbi:DUF6894 family protein [Rhizobium laguerreae]|uniref:DUF6894 family protein n=1 Tax=Rhizobium laguerreae TaxID=1076926 RepID=UPI0021B0B297|nr:hypothetical protein [Rhizobium laguerreae]
MARYYFHIRHGVTTIAEDLEGLAFATPEMAVEEATKAARELVVEMILAGNPGWKTKSLRLEVRTAQS